MHRPRAIRWRKWSIILPGQEAMSLRSRTGSAADQWTRCACSSDSHLPPVPFSPFLTPFSFALKATRAGPPAGARWCARPGPGPRPAWIRQRSTGRQNLRKRGVRWLANAPKINGAMASPSHPARLACTPHLPGCRNHRACSAASAPKRRVLRPRRHAPRAPAATVDTLAPALASLKPTYALQHWAKFAQKSLFGTNACDISPKWSMEIPVMAIYTVGMRRQRL